MKLSYFHFVVLLCMLSPLEGSTCHRPDQYVLYGCFKDKPQRAIKDMIASNVGKPKAVSKCASVTKSKGFWTFGVQYNGQCFSANNAQHTFSKYGGATNCKNGKGGTWANDVYFFVPRYVKQGCYKDRLTRAIGHMVANFPGDRFAVAKCAFLTKLRGYRAFGVQYNGQCFTGYDAHLTYGRYGESCACAATGRGGTWANEVYFLNHYMQVASFDTHGDRNAGYGMKAFVNAIPYGKIVLVAVQDEAKHYYNNFVGDALRTLGGTNFLIGYRGSYALIGYKGPRKNWVRELKHKRGKGPSEITASIFKGGYSYSIRIRSEGCEDKGKHGGCGRAFIWINGRDYSHHRRGYNIVVIR